MQIVDVKARLMEIPIPDPGVKWSWEPLHQKETTYTLIEIKTDDGKSGYGSVQLGREVVEFVEDRVKPLILTLMPDPFLAIGNLSKPLAIANWIGPRVSAVEIALWDVIGKTLKKPLHQLFGAARERVKAYVSTGQLRNPEKHAEFAIQVAEEGFNAIKLRARREKIEDDLAAVKAVRDAVGNDLDLIVDANQAWTYFPPYWSKRKAMKFARELEKHDVLWLEEPLWKDNLDGLVELRKNVEIPIAGGELEYGLPRFKILAEKRCYDILQADATFSGGISEMRKIATLAEAHGLEFIPHCWDSGIGIAANLQLIGSLSKELCPYMEFPYDPPWTPDIRDMMLKNPIKTKNGFVEIPKKNGLGVSMDAEYLEKYEVKSSDK